MSKSFFKDYFDDYDEEDVGEVLKNEGEVLKRFEELEKEYQEYLESKKEEYDLEKLFPTDSGLKELEYTLKSDDEIIDIAKKQTDYNKKQDADSIEAKYIEAQQSLLDNKDSAKQNLIDSYARLGALYNELKERVSDETLKRGLARSSIAVNSISDLQKAHLEEAGKQQSEYQKIVSDIDKNIEKLKLDKDNALDNLDLKYAVELDEKINELKKERDKTMLEYEEYNSEIREKNNEFAKDRELQVAEFLNEKKKEQAEKNKAQEAFENKYGYTGEKLNNYQKRYDIALDFYNSLSPDIAVAALKSSPNMKYYLGKMYDKLLQELSKRVS